MLVRICIYLLLVISLSFYSNAQIWEAANGGKTLPDSSSVSALVACGDSLFAATSRGVYFSVNNGDNWAAKNTGLKGKTVYSFVVCGNAILAAVEDGVYRTTDFGSSWVKKSGGMNGETINSFLKFGNTIFAGTSGGIYSSVNNGDSWTTANTGITDFDFTNISAMAVKGTDIYAGTSNGVYISTDNGNSWFLKTTEITDESIYSITMEKNYIFACGEGYGKGIYVSSNDGDNWTQKNNGLNPDVDLHYSLLTVGDSVWAGGYYSTGVFLTTDNGESWVAHNENLSAWIVNNELMLTKNNKYIFVSSKGGTGFCNCWKRSLVPIKPKGVNDNPNNIAYFNIYPNPVSKELKISYNLSINNLVTIQLYDILGTEVYSVSNIQRYAGQNNETIDLSNLPQGVYYLKLSAGAEAMMRVIEVVR